MNELTKPAVSVVDTATINALRDDVSTLRGKISDAKLDRKRGRDYSSVLAWFGLFVLAFFVALAYSAYLHYSGTINFGLPAVPPQPATGAAAQSAASGALPREKGDFRDLLTILVPVFGLGIAFVVSAAGMKRLQAYDQEFANAREERRKDAESLREEMRADRKELREELQTVSESVKQNIESFKSGFEKTVTDASTYASDRAIASLDDKVKQLNATATIAAKEATSEAVSAVSAAEKSTYATIQNFRERFDFLVDVKQLAQLDKGEITSIAELEEKVEQLFRERKSRAAVALLNAALEQPERLEGEPNDWFNLSAELGRNDFFGMGYRVCKLALDKYSRPDSPPNQDLLAHAIQYATKSAKWAEAAELVAVAEALGRDSWVWRTFAFVADYYETAGDIARFEAVSRDHMKYQPTDEKPYADLALFYRRNGKNTEAEDIIKAGLKIPRLRGARLYNLLADMQMVQNRFSEALESANAGLIVSAGEQPGIPLWALMYRRASALDAMCVQSLTQVPISDVEAKNFGARALAAYAAYTTLGKSNFTLENSSGERVKILHALLADAGVGPVPSVKPRDDDESDEAAASVTSPTLPKVPMPFSGITAQLVGMVEGMADDDWDSALKSIAEQLNAKFSSDIDALTTALRSSKLAGSARARSRLIALSSEVERLALIDDSVRSHGRSNDV
jgi:hypothetical protein